ncbi:hypothetical protein 3 [Diadegma semiclausum ichnovirus]|nr:hypothetical protein 3 [Diadegma semiclausum ichnovirus]
MKQKTRMPRSNSRGIWMLLMFFPISLTPGTDGMRTDAYIPWDFNLDKYYLRAPRAIWRYGRC